MGKQGSPRSPKPKNSILDVSHGVRDYQSRCSEMQQTGDPSLGRRGSGGDNHWDKVILIHGLRNDSGKFAAFKGVNACKKHTWWLPRHIRLIILAFVFMSLLFLLDSLLFSLLESMIKNHSAPRRSTRQEESITGTLEERSSTNMYDRLLKLAASSVNEKELMRGESKFWEESYPQASMWKPCANKKSTKGGLLSELWCNCLKLSGQGNPGPVLVTLWSVPMEA